MKHYKLVAIFTFCLLILTGCKKETEDKNEYFFFGVNIEMINRMELIHDNIIIYPSLTQEFDLLICDDLNTVIKSISDIIKIEKNELDIKLEDVQGYAQSNSENYFMYITFLTPQTLNIPNNDDKIENCDGVLFNIDTMKVYWSSDSNFVGTMNLKDISKSIATDYNTFSGNIKDRFADIN